MASLAIDDPPNSRLFVVAGRATSAEYLKSVFDQYGSVSFVKYLREKGVAYVKYDRASSAALAIESLHEVTLNDGQGPRLKVILADSPHTRTVAPLHQRQPPEEDNPSDPDNTPPRSRLFMVVPKSADGPVIEAEMSRFAGMQYCKTDLIATKGIVFVKYSKSSSACLAMETIQQTGMLAGYKVKVMLAEPKTRRAAVGPGFMPGLMGNGKGGLNPALLGGMGMAGQGYVGGAGSQIISSLSSAGLMGQGLGMPDYGLGSVGVLSSSGGFAAMPGMGGGGSSMAAFRGSSTPPLGPMDPSALSSQAVNLASLGLGGGMLADPMHGGMSSFGLGLPGAPAGLGTPMTPGGPGSSTSPNNLSKQRLFVVVHKSVSEEALSRLFRSFPGMEYCDLKRDRASGRSKGYCYVNYSTPEAAAAAQAQFNGIEFPQGSGFRLKVMFAEPLGSRSRSTGDFTAESQGGSGGFMQTQEGTLHMMQSPQDNSSGTIQLHTPLTGESGVLQGGYGLSSDPSPASHDTHTSSQSSPLRPGMGTLLDSADLAAVQSSLAQMSLHKDLNGLGGNGRQHHSPVSVSEGALPKWHDISPDQPLPGSQSCPISPLKPLQQDETVVYSALSRPLPDYSLAHLFSQCGPVEYVRLLGDERVAMVKYASPEGARHALATLNGSEVLGEVLQVRASPPLPMHSYTP